MPSPHFRTEITALIADAAGLFAANRNARFKKIRRSIKRSFKYGQGKKTALKLGVGIGLGVIFVGVSVGTAGIATAGLVAGLAIGSFIVGQATDGAFAKLAGRKYTGGAATEDWIKTPTPPENAEQAKVLDERAHKTVRRAFQHYRTASDKKKELISLNAGLPRPLGSCQASVDLVMGVLHTKRHLDKARIYINPSHFILSYLVGAYDELVNKFNKPTAGTASIDDFVQDTLKALMAGHNAKCDSEWCYWEKQTPKSAAGSTPPLKYEPNLEPLKTALEEASERIALSNGKFAISTSTLHAGTIALYTDAKRKYAHRTISTKVKHSIVNAWQRKSKSEQKAFVLNKAVGTALSGASAGAGGALFAHNINLAPVVEFAVEGGFQAAGNTLSEVIDRNVDETLASQQDISRQKHGSKLGADSQEALRHAAIHVGEALRLVAEQAEDPESGGCESQRNEMYALLKLRHHLERAHFFLKEAVAFVCQLTTAIEQSAETLRIENAQIVAAIDAQMRSRHDNCHTVGAVCYGSHPPRPLA